MIQFIYSAAKLFLAWMHALSVTRCVLCGCVANPFAPEYSSLCTGCASLLEEQIFETCETCGAPLVSEREKCLKCRETNDSILHCTSIFRYSGKARILIREYKFGGHAELSYYFAYRVAAQCNSKDILVPVPPRKAKTKVKGWDQVELIMSILEREYHFNVARILENTGSHERKKMSRTERMAQSDGKIRISETPAIRKKIKELLKNGQKIIVFDDVMTTGSTLQECKKALEKEGFSGIKAFVLARD